MIEVKHTIEGELRVCLQGCIDRNIVVIDDDGDIVIHEKAEVEGDIKLAIQGCIDRGDLTNPWSMKDFPVEEVLQILPPVQDSLARFQDEQWKKALK